MDWSALFPDLNSVEYLLKLPWKMGDWSKASSKIFKWNRTRIEQHLAFTFLSGILYMDI